MGTTDNNQKKKPAKKKASKKTEPKRVYQITITVTDDGKGVTHEEIRAEGNLRSAKEIIGALELAKQSIINSNREPQEQPKK